MSAKIRDKICPVCKMMKNKCVCIVVQKCVTSLSADVSRLNVVTHRTSMTNNSRVRENGRQNVSKIFSNEK